PTVAWQQPAAVPVSPPAAPAVPYPAAPVSPATPVPPPPPVVPVSPAAAIPPQITPVSPAMAPPPMPVPVSPAAGMPVSPAPPMAPPPPVQPQYRVGGGPGDLDRYASSMPSYANSGPAAGLAPDISPPGSRASWPLVVDPLTDPVDDATTRP